MQQAKPEIEEYKNFSLILLDDWYALTDEQGKVQVYLVENAQTQAYFVFAVLGREQGTDLYDQAKQKAKETIKSFITAGSIQNYSNYTFTYTNGVYEQRENPHWWQALARDYRF